MDELPSGHSKGGGFSSAALGGSAALPSGTDPRTGQKGADPRTGTPQRRNVFLPGCFVSSLSWPACGGAFLVPGRWFSGPAPSGSCLFWFRLVFLFLGRGRHVPAPSGRDVGSNSGAPTQEPVQGADPRTGFFRYSSTYVFLVYFVAPALFFPFLFATLFSLMRLSFEMLSGYPRLLTVGLKLSSVWIGEVLFALGHHCLDVPRSVRARHLRSLNVMLCSPWLWCSYAVCRVSLFLRPILCLVRGGTRRVIIVIA